MLIPDIHISSVLSPKFCFRKKIFPIKTLQVIGLKGLLKMPPKPLLSDPTDPTEHSKNLLARLRIRVLACPS